MQRHSVKFKTLGLVGAVCFSAGAFAQATPLELIDRIKLIYDGFSLDHVAGGTAHAFGLRMSTTDTIDGRTDSYETWLTWYASKITKHDDFRIQVYVTKNGKAYKRIVGNGETMFAYDFTRNEYSAQAYGKYGGIQPNNYGSNFITFLNQVAPPEARPAVRFAIEVDGYDAPSYQSWLSGVTPTGQKQVDIYVPPVTYIHPDNMRMIRFNAANGPTPMSIELITDSVLGGKNRRIQSVLREWTAAERGALIQPSDVDFKFIPPSRSIRI